MVIRTLRYHYDNAEPWTREAGADWYGNARLIAQQLAERYSVTLEQAAGVIAALSQRQRWKRNLELARQCLAGERLTGIFGHMHYKVEDILAGEHPLDVLRGPKIIAFYRAIMGDDWAVVLDTWMLDSMAPGHWTTEKQYYTLAQRLAEQAVEVGLLPAQFQAIIWIQLRGDAS